MGKCVKHATLSCLELAAFAPDKWFDFKLKSTHMNPTTSDANGFGFRLEIRRPLKS